MLTITLAITAVCGCDSEPGVVSLPPPALQGPDDRAVFETRSFVEFSWTPVDGADSYQVSFEYEDYPDADTIVTTLVPLTVHRLADIGNVQWRVRAISSNVEGSWSQRRTVMSLPSIVQGSFLFAPEFSTAGFEVGETLSVTSGQTFSLEVFSRLVDYGAAQRDIRDIVIAEFRIEVTKPTGTVLDQFSNWRITAGPPQNQQTIHAIPEPAPAVASHISTDFVRPDDWIELALEGTTVIGMSADVNPRTPKETEVGWSVSLQYTLLLNR